MFEKFKFGLIATVALALTACGTDAKDKVPSADAPFSAANSTETTDASDTLEGTETVEKVGYLILLNGQGNRIGAFKVVTQVAVQDGPEVDSNFDAPLSVAKDGGIIFTTDTGQTFRWGGEYMYSDQDFAFR